MSNTAPHIRFANLIPSAIVLLATLPIARTAPVAHAFVDIAPVKLRLVSAAGPAAAGRPFAARFELVAASNTTVTSLRMTGQEWSSVTGDGTGAMSLGPGESRSIDVRAMPSEGFGPLVFTATVDGRPWRRTVDLSPDAFAGWKLPGDDSSPGRRVLPAGGDLAPAEVRPGPGLLEAIRVEPPARRGPLENPVHVTGRLRYWNENLERWCDPFGAKVRFYYSVNGINWSSSGNLYTGTDGAFSCDIPPGNTVGFVWFQASNRAAIVESSVSEIDYEWTTGIIDLPAGSQIDIGHSWPLSRRGALHIMSDLTWQHDYFITLGWDMDNIDVQWPDSDGSLYRDQFGEIHLATGDGWSDGTIGHEWGHYWGDAHAHHPTMDYCNGVCDEAGCGHCMWCPERGEVAWNEGLAQIVSRIATDHLDANVDFTVGHKPIGTVVDAPGCDWDPWYTEGIFAAAMYDMVDPDRGTEADRGTTDVLGEVLRDQLDLEDVDVLNILSESCDALGHEPYRATGFFICAKEYIESLGRPDATWSDLWETALNCGIQTDSLAPPHVMGLASSVPEGVPTRTSRVGFTWDPSTDDFSGTAGYSFTLAAGEPVYPDSIIDTRGTVYNSNQLTPGSWYFVVRPIDRAGHAQPSTAIVGPIIVLAPEPADVAPETPAGWSAPLVVRANTVPAPDPVTQPSVVNGDSIYLNWGERNQGSGATGNFRDQLFLDGAPIDTSSIHYLGAGATVSFRNQGPHDLDLTGRHTLWVNCDQPDSVPETDEMDNIYAKQFVFVPRDLSPGAWLHLTDAMPDPFAGQELLPPGTPFYPNGHGYDCDLSILPEVIWVTPHFEAQGYTLRLHPRTTGQGGFAAPLLTSDTGPDTPAAVLNVPTESGLTAFHVGVSAREAGQAGYYVSREECRYLALPDSLNDSLWVFDHLNGYGLLNDVTGADAWFTIRLLNRGSDPLSLRLFQPGFATGTLAAADTMLLVEPMGTLTHHLWLPDDGLVLAVVGRESRSAGVHRFVLQFHHQKPDVEAHRPADWFANAVPATGTPYNPADPVPAPASLSGGTATTSVYHSLRVASPDAGVPAGLQHRVDLDGEALFSQAFIQPLDPGEELRLLSAPSTLYTVRGGRHALTHLVNSSGYIDEDEYTNNRFGRQWCWSPRALTVDSTFSLPAPPDPFGGFSMLTEGRIAPNCDGYVVSEFPSSASVFAAYSWDETLDIDLGLYASAHVDTGFTTTLTESQASGVAADFVLEYMPQHRPYFHFIGALRGPGASTGTFTLRAARSSDQWSNPVSSSRTGTIEAGTCLDVTRLTLPTGTYRLELTGGDVPLGFSLHDVSDGFSSRTEPFSEGLAVETGTERISFVVSVPDTAPSTLALVVWRRDGSSVAEAARWRVAVSSDLTDVVAAQPALPAVSRLLAAAPNPFSSGTAVAFETSREGDMRIDVYDVTGRLVRSLATGRLAPGRHQAWWDGADAAGRPVPGGVYLVRLDGPAAASAWMKLVLLR